MPRPLIDLLWRGHPDAPTRGTRGPRPRHSTGDVVDRAVALADASGLEAVTVRALAESLRMPTMSVYTHVNNRDDLLVLMADSAHAAMRLPAFGRAGWRTRVRRVAEANLDLHRVHPWLGQVADARVALGPGTIAKYDHELHAFDDTGLRDVDRDAALTFVLDFVRSSAASLRLQEEDFGEVWADAAPRLSRYLGEAHPLARRVGAAAGEHLGTPYHAGHAWEFGLQRVLAGLTDLLER